MADTRLREQLTALLSQRILVLDGASGTGSARPISAASASATIRAISKATWMSSP